MTRETFLESAYPLITLPKSISPEKLNTYASPVLSLKGGKKRKYGELATTVSGDSVSIYNIEDSSVITSHAVSPQTIFECPPCSIRDRSESSSTTSYCTYTASRNSIDRETVRLSCYESGTLEPGSSASWNSENLHSSSQVVSLNAIPSLQVARRSADPHILVSVQTDGSVEAFAKSRSSGSIWHSNIQTLTPNPDRFHGSRMLKVISAVIESVEFVSQGILRGRQDALVGLDPTLLVMCIVALHQVRADRPPEHFLHFYTVSSRNSKEAGKALEHLFSWHLPTSQSPLDPHSELHHSLDMVTGSIIIFQDNIMTSFDLSGAEPRESNIVTMRERPLSVEVLSTSVALIVTRDRYSVVDTRYGTVLESVPLQLGKPNAQTKENLSEVSHQQLQFIGYFEKQDVALVLRRNYVGAVRLNPTVRQIRRKNVAISLLQSLGKGAVDAMQISDGHDSSVQNDHTDQAVFDRLDELLLQDRIDEFDKHLATYAHFSQDEASLHKAGLPSDVVLQRHSLGSESTQRSAALYALSRLFEVVSDDRDGQTTNTVLLKVLPLNNFAWLVRTAQLSATSLETAMWQNKKTEVKIPNGDIVKALAEFDPDFDLIRFTLQNHPDPHLDELAAAVALVINETDVLPQPVHKPETGEEYENTAMATGGLIITKSVRGMDKSHKEDTIMYDAADEAVEEDMGREDISDAALQRLDEMLDAAEDSLERKLPNRGETLRIALTRLHALPSHQVVDAFRRHLTHDQLIFLIHTLRVELDEGGWTTRYANRKDDKTDDYSSASSSDADLRVIVGMLNCAVDVIGLGGWLAASAANPQGSVDETIFWLRTEASAALEAVHECSFLTGVVADFLRYATKRKVREAQELESHLEQSDELRENHRPAPLIDQKKTKPTSSSLPIGLRDNAEDPVKPTNLKLSRMTMSGREEKLDSRTVAMQRNRKLPPYVFESVTF